MAQKEQLIENDDEQKLEDEEIEVIVEDDDKEPPSKEGKSEEKAPEKDAKIRSEDDEEDEDDDDGESEEELRERRRKEKLARKERRDKAIARDKLEMTFLRQRNEELEKRMRAQELRADRQDHYTLEQRIEEAEEQARMAEQVIAKAIAEANGDDATKAIRIRDEALEKIRQLQYYRDRISKQEEPKQKDKPGIDPLVASFAQAWIAKNDWYDPQSGDLDSRIVLAIDQSLVDEGYVPKTAQYWKELDRRVRAKLPHRFNDEHTFDEDEDTSSAKSKPSNKRSRQNERDDEADSDDTRGPNRVKKGPPVGQQSESGLGAKKKEIYISKDRKEALIQAGVWDDPVLRMRYIKRYQDWDKENASR